MIERNLKGQLMKGNQINKGRKHTEEWKIENGKRNKGEKNPNWGKPMSEKQKKLISKSRTGKCLGNTNGFTKGQIPWNRGKPHLIKEKNPMWKGGVSTENEIIRSSIEYKLWEDSILSRDNWKCQKCGEIRISKLTAHHIKNFAQFPELRFAIDNGITFCKECHKLFHHIFGIKNNDREQLENFLRTDY